MRAFAPINLEQAVEDFIDNDKEALIPVFLLESIGIPSQKEFKKKKKQYSEF